MSSLLHEFAVAEDLQEDQASADEKAPYKEDSTQQIEAGVLAGNSIRGNGYYSLKGVVILRPALSGPKDLTYDSQLNCSLKDLLPTPAALSS